MGLEYEEILSEPDLTAMLDAYFNSPILTKVKDISDSSGTPIYSMYACKLHCLLNRQCRYIIVIIKYDDLNIGFQCRFAFMNWISFQTRTLDANYQIQSHHYQPTKNTPLMKKIKQINQTTEAIEYSCEDLPIVISLLTTNEQPSYQQEGSLVAALETFQTVITKV